MRCPTHLAILCAVMPGVTGRVECPRSSGNQL